MNKPTIIAMAAAALAVVFSTTASSVNLQPAYAQSPYGAGTDTGAVGPAQLAECDQLGIDRDVCTNVAILAKKRVTDANREGAYGSGTQFLGGATSTIIFIAALGAIFGGVAAAFFFKGRGSKPTT
ncbi:MAG: hypothetical protein ACREBU_19755 [Nitrososphaera sp.]